MQFDLLTIGISIFVFLVLVAFLLFKKYYNKESLEDENVLMSKYRDLGVTLFVSPECPFCKKQKKFLKENGLLELTEIINIETPEGEKLFNETGEEGVPLFISKKTSKRHSGYTKDIFHLLKALKA